MEQSGEKGWPGLRRALLRPSCWQGPQCLSGAWLAQGSNGIIWGAWDHADQLSSGGAGATATLADSCHVHRPGPDRIPSSELWVTALLPVVTIASVRIRCCSQLRGEGTPRRPHRALCCALCPFTFAGLDPHPARDKPWLTLEGSHGLQVTKLQSALWSSEGP